MKKQKPQVTVYPPEELHTDIQRVMAKKPYTFHNVSHFFVVAASMLVDKELNDE